MINLEGLSYLLQIIPFFASMIAWAVLTTLWVRARKDASESRQDEMFTAKLLIEMSARSGNSSGKGRNREEVLSVEQGPPIKGEAV